MGVRPFRLEFQSDPVDFLTDSESSLIIELASYSTMPFSPTHDGDSINNQAAIPKTVFTSLPESAVANPALLLSVNIIL